MWYHHPEEFEPLLHESPTDLVRSKIEITKEISQSIQREQSILGAKFRGASLTRWYILFGLTLSWFTTYFNSISPLYLIKSEITDNDYACIVSITYILAAFSPLFIPRILLFFNGSSMMTLICIQFVSLSGEILVYLGSTGFSLSSIHLILLYIGRILIGIALGCNDTIILSMLIFWFSESRNMSFSSTFISLSILCGRLCLGLMHNASVDATYFVSIPIVLNFISIWMLFAINCVKNKNVAPIYDVMMYNNGAISINNIFWKWRSIPNVLWLIIFSTALVLSHVEILYALFLPNVLSTVYSFSLNSSFIILMLSVVFIILWSAPISYIMDCNGYHIQWNLCCSFSLFLSLLFLFFGANQRIFAIVSLSLLSISALFIASYFTLTILSTKPIEFAPYIATLITMLHWSLYLLFTLIISWFDARAIAMTPHIPNHYGNLESILFILATSFVQFLISALIYGITLKSKLNLHAAAAPTKDSEIQ